MANNMGDAHSGNLTVDPYLCPDSTSVSFWVRKGAEVVCKLHSLSFLLREGEQRSLKPWLLALALPLFLKKAYGMPVGESHHITGVTFKLF